jgi:hypothetical protein
MDDDGRILAEVTGLFLGRRKRRVRRVMPRCLGCRRVSRAIFCSDQCRERYRQNQKEGGEGR